MRDVRQRSRQTSGSAAASALAQQLTSAFHVVHDIGAGCPSPREFARRGTSLLPRLVASEITTLSICDLASGRRHVVSNPHHAFSVAELSAFDRHFFSHPLVRFHSSHHTGGVHRISDSLSAVRFRATPLYADYYRKVGLDHSLALPLHVDGRTLVSFVLNRTRRDFTDGERDLLEALRPVLADLFHASVILAGWRSAISLRTPMSRPVEAAGGEGGDLMETLTPREREVLGWVSAGKSNRQIADILGASTRTIAKHLERVYEKLGVETRTAAAMRASRTATADARAHGM